MTTLPIIAGLNVKAYGKLLAKFAPRVIQTEQENENALAIVESLIARGDANLSAEELALLDLLGHLIERFESNTYITPDGNPAGTLQLLMDGRNLKPADLAATLGSRAKVSEILSGKRAISKAQAKRLGDFFHVSPAAFI